jgi:formylmethanofuran dehydrogenase subunit C
MGCLACAALMLDRGGITLYRKESSSIPVEADSICPDRFLGRGPAEIERLPAYYGRRKVTLGDLFDVDGAGADNITVSGDLKHVKKIGLGMTMGTITVTGDVGPHLGAHMSGGEIVVQGGAGDWVGAHMSGGRIVVDGDAGHFAGAAYSGASRGVTGGAIIIGGSVGNEAGARMRRGSIVVFGDSGEFTGAHMIAGTIIVFGDLGARAGAGMKRGTIVAMGSAPEMLPTFRYACRFQPTFLRFYLRRLREWGLVIDPELDGADYRRFLGDINESGRGEVLVRDQSQ